MGAKIALLDPWSAPPTVAALLNCFGRVEQVFPPHARALGYAAKELIGRRALELVHPEDRATLRQAEGNLQTSVSLRVQH